MPLQTFQEQNRNLFFVAQKPNIKLQKMHIGNITANTNLAMGNCEGTVVFKSSRSEVNSNHDHTPYMLRSRAGELQSEHASFDPAHNALEKILFTEFGDCSKPPSRNSSNCKCNCN